MQYTSNAQWPSTVSLGNTDNVSSDIHETRDLAEAICRRLRLRGFGGDGKIFPLRTWVGETAPLHGVVPESLGEWLGEHSEEIGAAQRI